MSKYALITGASGGIGSALARKLAKDGYSLYLHYHKNIEGMKNLLSELAEYKHEYIPIQADLTDKKGIEKLCGNIFALDAIVHNCGQSHYGLLVDLKDDDLEQIMKLQVTAPILLTKHLLPKLLERRNGQVVVISSIWGQTGAACEVAYSAAKGAQIAFVKALSKEVALSGITVNAVAPGAIQTPMLENFSDEELEELKQEIPVGRLGSSEEVAEAVSFLLSSGSRYITGQTIAVNGGWYT
ncbi:elongation factor P 5-aminopentanone reductase [Robertmurraya korlensis]|uniref:elongation factor P 5-aminopentanone reductase n=1 Tax=Robertmurraya korlensis TaxID=519977 RepID=UPI000826B006|nr:SDR family oxidoreductase [Robertmurraya korlensis]